MAPSLSFVIPAWNEESLLPRTLDAIHAAAEGREYEVVVADDASEDRTAEVAREHGARVVSCSHRHIAATRNSGARETTGEILVFVDADTVVSRGAVDEVVAAIEGGAVYGGAQIRFDSELSLVSRALFAAMLVTFRWFGLCAGAFVFCTREAFEATGGFDEEVFASEEIWFSLALRKLGRHGWVRAPVTTSARKLRTHSTFEMLWIFTRLTLGGRRGVKRRHDLWYGERRPDPGEGSRS